MHKKPENPNQTAEVSERSADELLAEFASAQQPQQGQPGSRGVVSPFRDDESCGTGR